MRESMGPYPKPGVWWTKSDPPQRSCEIYTLTMLPPGGRTPVGVVLFHHGFTDHSGRHISVLTPLAEAGFAVLAYDARGHGRSGPKSTWLRSYVWDFNDLINDLIGFSQDTRNRFPGLPLFVMGHSMGAAICALAAGRQPDLFSGVLLSSPLVRLLAEPHSLKMRVAQALVATLNRTVPGLSYARVFFRRPIQEGMNDQEAVKAMESDPHWDPLAHRLGSVCSMLQCTRLMHEEAPIGLRGIPTYIQQGTADAATKCEYLREFLETSGLGPLLPPVGITSRDAKKQHRRGKSDDSSSRRRRGGVTYFEVEGGFHDLNHDLATPDCIGHILTWLNHQISVE